MFALRPASCVFTISAHRALIEVAVMITRIMFVIAVPLPLRVLISLLSPCLPCFFAFITRDHYDDHHDSSDLESVHTMMTMLTVATMIVTMMIT